MNGADDRRASDNNFCLSWRTVYKDRQSKSEHGSHCGTSRAMYKPCCQHSSLLAAVRLGCSEALSPEICEITLIEKQNRDRWQSSTEK